MASNVWALLTGRSGSKPSPKRFIFSLTEEFVSAPWYHFPKSSRYIVIISLCRKTRVSTDCERVLFSLFFNDRRTGLELWGRGSQEQSHHQRSGWTSLTLFSVVHSATMALVLNAALI
ncbi:hypothetical protein LOK49_LG09G01983 [Camellia lanceoleosa]|uniref:Uncharacterized protein n=1 Tax=Camellia lanceoleosa TaxID=1840588 RepID=A0ACC0GM45_9ERIC|nr:hypothetical protein LOK49_LG09G01983 [Camellia lanceoleosa]